MRASLLVFLALALTALPFSAPAHGQDVEMLGERFGTQPPPGYWEELARDPNAFQFEREGLARLRYMQQLRGAPFQELIGPGGERAAFIGPRDVPMVGTFRFPLVLGLFSDSPEPAFTQERVQQEFFDGPNSYYRTIPEFFDEMSGGRVTLEGVTHPWVRTGLTRSQVVGLNNGLSSSRNEGVGAFIEQVVAGLDAQGVDWTEFDLTGDGFVDVLTVMHPQHGAECGGGGGRVWSHRWSIRNATQGRLDPGIRTNTPRPGGDGYIYIRDYTIQPLLDCDASNINRIGVFAHELGHGFGLPDLYGTYGAATRGVGRWDLMGTGVWGCQGSDAARPCHMGAWSKAMLGWVDVQTVPADTDLGSVSLPPVLLSNEVLRIDAMDGTDQYLLLENRQRIGFDGQLWEPGLLVWHVDESVLAERWTSNTVNTNANRLGVWLRQADGRDELARVSSNHGDPGDPFPGCIKDDYWDYFNPNLPCVRRNRVFHAGSEPAARTHEGVPFGLTLTGIELTGSAPHNVRFDLSTRLTRVTLEAEGEGPVPTSPFRADGMPVPGDPVTLEAAPFDTRVIEAPPGESIADGVRFGFLGWHDGAGRVREFVVPERDTALVARYGGEEVRVRWAPSSDIDGPVPGSLLTTPESTDLWFPRGTSVLFEAEALTGFAFREWTGALAGAANPVTRVVDGPIDVGADFVVDYRVDVGDDPIRIEAARQHSIALEVVNGTEPVQWGLVEGTLPEGLALQTVQARLFGTPMESGRFGLTLRATDGRGLVADAEVVLEVGPPVLGIGQLTAPFLERDGGPTPLQAVFLDRQGNENGVYDVGDLRAFLREHPEVAGGALPGGAPGAVAAARVGTENAAGAGSGGAAGAEGAAAGSADGVGRVIRIVFPGVER